MSEPGTGGPREPACDFCGEAFPHSYAGGSTGRDVVLSNGCSLCRRWVCRQPACALSWFDHLDTEVRLCRDCQQDTGIHERSEEAERRLRTLSPRVDRGHAWRRCAGCEGFWGREPGGRATLACPRCDRHGDFDACGGCAGRRVRARFPCPVCQPVRRRTQILKAAWRQAIGSHRSPAREPEAEAAGCSVQLLLLCGVLCAWLVVGLGSFPG